MSIREKITKTCLAGFVLLAGIGAMNARAFWGDSSGNLAVINEVKLSTDDFRNWWREWKELDTPFPETPAEFIDWMVLFQEAERMRLFENETYRRKISVFLKVRTLMLLKFEEVDSKIQVPGREDLWRIYQKESVPVYRLGMVAAEDSEQAESLKAAAGQGIFLEEAARKAGLVTEEKPMGRMGPVRASKIPEPFALALSGQEAGKVVGPVHWKNTWYLLEIEEKNPGDDDDFNSLKDSLTRQYYRQKEGELTRALVERLRNKYSVTIDEKVVRTITADGVPDETAHKAAVAIAGNYVDARTLYESVTKENRMRGGSRTGDGESFDQTLNRVIDDILSQTLLGMESLNRHYEKKPPFRHTYEFYCQHRMIKELENALVTPAVQVSEAEVRAFYEAHPERYSRKQIAEFALVQIRDGRLAENLEAQLAAGEDFFRVMAPYAPQGIPVQRLPMDHLPDVQRETVENLGVGETSRAVQDGEKTYFIKLIRRSDSEHVDFDKVAEEILGELQRERFAQVRKKLLDQLKEKSRIEINDRAWKNLRLQLAEEMSRENAS